MSDPKLVPGIAAKLARLHKAVVPPHLQAVHSSAGP